MQNAALTLAISKAIAKKAETEAREAVGEETTIAVDATVRIRGDLTVGKSAMTTQVNKLCPWKLALAAINKLNGASVEALVREAQGLDEKATKPLKDKVKDAAEELLGTVVQRRAAPIKFKGIAEPVA
jgi:hypothetical protein